MVLQNKENYNLKNAIDDPVYFVFGSLLEIVSGSNIISLNDTINENSNSLTLKELNEIDEK